MIFDVAKFVIWLIERYDLHQEVLNYVADSGEVPVLNENDKMYREKPVQVQPGKPYLMHFDQEFITEKELRSKIIECSNTGGNDRNAQ